VFRADEVIAQALDRHPRFVDPAFPPDLMARQFNRAMRWALTKLAPYNPEAFTQHVVIPDDEVVLEPDFVDLTRGDVIDWHTIDAIDWRSSSAGRWGRQLPLGTQEARHRIKRELEHLRGPKGYLYDAQRKLWKLGAWEPVFDLRISGIPYPERALPHATAVEYPYLEDMADLVAVDLALRLAPAAKVGGGDRAEWREERKEGLEDVGALLKMRVTQGAVLEDIPFFDGS
jgi:hypothetical protein